jgi:hypothetical protein
VEQVEPLPDPQEERPDFATQIKTYYVETLKPFIDRLNMVPNGEHSTGQNDSVDRKGVKALYITDELLWMTIVGREEYLYNFTQAIRNAGTRDASGLESVVIKWDDGLFGAQDIPWNTLGECLREIGLALSVCTDLKKVHLRLAYQNNFQVMDYIVAEMLQPIQQIQELGCFVIAWMSNPCPT